jgi:CHASE2 domain-containing sensor protein
LVAATVVLMFWAPRLLDRIENALFDRMVRVVPSTLPMTFSEVEPPDSRLRPL